MGREGSAATGMNNGASKGMRPSTVGQLLLKLGAGAGGGKADGLPACFWVYREFPSRWRSAGTRFRGRDLAGGALAKEQQRLHNGEGWWE